MMPSGGHDALWEDFVGQAYAAGTLDITLGIDATEIGFRIKEFTGQFRVINTALKINFFIAAAATPATDGFPFF